MGPLKHREDPGNPLSDRDWTRALGALCAVLFIGLACAMVVTTSSLVLEGSPPEIACYSLYGHCPEAWTAIGTFGLIAATVVLVAVGLYQTNRLVDDARLNRSLAACDRYDHDPIIDHCLRRIRFRQAVFNDPANFRIDVSTLLNYLDGLASGANQNTYSKPFVMEHMRSIMLHHAQEFLNAEARALFRLEKKDYEALLRLLDLWDET